jgi:hypothetical protein
MAANFAAKKEKLPWRGGMAASRNGHGIRPGNRKTRFESRQGIKGFRENIEFTQIGLKICHLATLLQATIHVSCHMYRTKWTTASIGSSRHCQSIM